MNQTPRTNRIITAAGVIIASCSVLGIGFWGYSLATSSKKLPTSSQYSCFDVSKLSPEARLAQQVFAYAPPNSREWQRLGLGGVLVNRSHGPSIAQYRVSSETMAAQHTPGQVPVMLGIDQEGGAITRLRDPSVANFPTNALLGQAKTGQQQVTEQGRVYGRALRDAKVHIAFAPVVDVATVKGTIIGQLGRSYGANPSIVSTRAAGFVRGLHSNTVAATLKHFPGHGMVLEDSHTELPSTDISREALNNHLAPFRTLLSDPTLNPELLVVMTAHVLYRRIDPKWPASQSNIITTGLLRQQLGFKGVIISDALGMKALSGSITTRAEAVLAAGADMVLLEQGLQGEIPGLIKTLLDKYNKNPGLWQKNAQSLERIFKLKRALGLRCT
jgi:beta-glucosidase-like glycosyl hydrolase